jgi:hypothetical protein
MKYRDYNDYDVHPNGDIVSMKYGKKRILKHQVTRTGYHRVPISSTKGKFKTILVSRLVAECFIPNPLNLPQVNHKDGDKNNNNDWNLEWCTQQENLLHALNTGLRIMPTGENHPSHKITILKVLEIREKYKNGNYTLQELADEYGISNQSVSLIISYKTWKNI